MKRSAAKSQKHSQFLKKPSLLGGVARSSPSSPSSSVLASPLLLPAPTSVPLVFNPDMEAQRALRKPLIHLLAIRPATRDGLLTQTRCTKTQCSLVLEKVARQIAGSDHWKLTDKAFKELDVWGFKYMSQEDREAAINNAVRAYDRMRLSKEDKLWQMLLPKEERGKGKVLSRLNIQDGSKGALTPNPTARLLDKKTGLPKKLVVKRTVKDGESRAQDTKAAKQESTGLESKKAAKDKTVDSGDKKAVKEKATNGQASKVQQASEKKTSLGKPGKASEASCAKQINGSIKPAPDNKPKDPSPLSASPPVNASDFEDDHPVHKALSAVKSPKKSSDGNSDTALKRKANDLDHDIHKHDESSKQAKLDTNESSSKSGNPPSTSSSSSGTTIAKRKPQDVDSDAPTRALTKYRKLSAGDRESIARRAVAPASQHLQWPDHSPQSDVSTTPPVPLSYRQTLLLAQRFRTYYERYQKMWQELSQATDPPSEQKREELMRMHRKLEEMKRDINNGALRHWGRGEAGDRRTNVPCTSVVEIPGG